MFKRFLCFFIICVLVISPVSVYASSAGSVTVATGSGSAVGGLFSDYGINSRTGAIALTLAFLNSLGATVKLTDQAIQAGKSVADVIYDKFAQWVGGSSAESMTEEQKEELKKRFKVINGGGSSSDGDNGTNIGPDGKIYFGLGALGILTEFFKFLQSKDDIKPVPAVDPVSYVDLGVCTTVLSTSATFSYNGGITYYCYECSKPCAVIKMTIDGNPRGLCFVCNENYTLRSYIYNTRDGTISNDNTYSKTTEQGYTVDLFSQYLFSYFEPENAANVPDYQVYRLRNYITKWEVSGSSGGITEDGIYADNLDTSKLENPDNKDLVVDPGLLPNIQTDSDQKVAIPDYLQYILDNANANASQSNDPLNVPVTDPNTLSPGQITTPVQQQDPIQSPVPSELVDPVNTPVNPVQDPSTPVDPGDAIPRLIFPLDEYFPFCIPFDIYALLSKFSADPVAPVFDWSFTEPFSQSVVTVHIDLSMWDSVASAVRVAELGAFIVGLAVVSRKIFTRG